MTETDSVTTVITPEAAESVTTETPSAVLPDVSAYGVLNTIRRMACDATYVLSQEDEGMNDALRQMYFTATLNAIAELIDLDDVNTRINFVKPSED